MPKYDFIDTRQVILSNVLTNLTKLILHVHWKKIPGLTMRLNGQQCLNTPTIAN